MAYALQHSNSEEYLISKTKKYLSINPSAAKAWMITAKSLFPKDFYVQYEAYKMERDYKNTKKAACYLAELIRKFPNEPGLLKEMQNIADALRTKTKNEHSIFLKKIFKRLSNDVKYKILSTVANHCEEPMEHCRLMLLLLQELPSQLFQHGEKVIDTLLMSEKLSHCNYPVNQFRKLLVCDAMPTILFTTNFKLPSKLLFRLLQTAIEFYICYIFSPSDEDLQTDLVKIDKYEDWKSAKIVLNVWKPLFVLMKTAGQQLRWNLVDLFSSRVSFLYELSWEKILSMIRKKLSFGETSDHNSSLASGSSCEISPYDKEVFLCTTVIYFYCLYQFAKLVGPKYFSKSVLQDVHYILIEGIHLSNDGDSEPMHKKLKLDKEFKKFEKSPPLTVSKSASPDMADSLTQSFVTAIKIWELLHRSYSLNKEFTRLCQVIEMENWPCFQEYFIDMLIYQGCHKEAISHLMRIHAATNDEFIKNKTSLQLASCLNFINEHVKACEYLFDVICTFSTLVTPMVDVQLPSARSSHHLHFIAYNQAEILQYCIELLISIYKKRVPTPDNLILGHLLVLSQYNWPREETLFLHCIKQIQQNGNFCFAKFFNYIIIPEILEEFMFLTTTGGGTVTLDLLPTSTMQVGKQRAVTRGVNKGAKEDLRGSMKKQMVRCDESLDDLFVTFIRQERIFIKMIIV